MELFGRGAEATIEEIEARERKLRSPERSLAAGATRIRKEANVFATSAA
jgi:hypothetical protein